MAEKITRGEVRQTLELLLRLNPINFTKDVLYTRLAPIVRALAHDLGKHPKDRSDEKTSEEKGE